MRMSHFWTLMDDEFGPAYAGSLARDHVLGALQHAPPCRPSPTAWPREVWEALCDDMDVPPERRLGRDDRVARGAQGGQAGGAPDVRRAACRRDSNTCSVVSSTGPAPPPASSTGRLVVHLMSAPAPNV